VDRPDHPDTAQPGTPVENGIGGSVRAKGSPFGRHPEGLTEILAWLAAPDAADPAQDLQQIGRQLAALDQAPVDPPRYHRILDLFYDRAHRLSQALRPRLSEASLPLEHGLRRMAMTLIEIHGLVAAGYERVLRDAGDRLAHNKRRNPSIIAGRALRSLGEQLETSSMAAAGTPPDLWRRAHALARAAREHYEPESTVVPGLGLDTEKIYKAMLALAAAQPEGFSPAEIALASDYLTHFSAAVEILPSTPGGGAAPQEIPAGHDAWYWVDTDRDMAPVPAGRRIPPHHGGMLFCSFQRLARLLGEQISALEAGMPAGNLRLPEHAAGHSGRSALKRLQAHWIKPPHRQHARRHNNYRAQVCIGLTELWHLLEHGELPEGLQAGASHATEWMVLNESPGGFAVMHVSGEVDGLVPGSAIALRPAPEKPWSICIVRWMKSENPEHIELGLELLAPGARSVQLMFRNGDPEQRPTPGLLLPAIPALREHEALLAPSGSYSSRRFFIVSGDEKTQVTQGRLLSLDLQTGSIELFQFEPDPYPL
jgi:hypothetical protein